MTTLSLSSSPAGSLTVDAYVVGTTQGSGKRPVSVAAPNSGLAPAARTALEDTLAAVGATGKAGEVVRVPGGGAVKAPLVVAVGLGSAPTGRGTHDAESLRRAAGAAVRDLAGTRRVALSFPATTPAEVEAVAQGALLGAYAFDRFRGTTAEDRKAPVAAVTVVVGKPRDRALRDAATRAEIVSAEVNRARDLVNTPPSHLHPADLAAAARAAMKGLPVTVDVLDEKALRRDGFGGILAVGQGSANPPRLVRMAYRPRGATTHLALVGKGITFDSGGLSLKPPKAMEAMKSDMGGAAAVIAAVAAIARMGLPVQVTGWAPSAENMPSGTAQRPSDVITIYGGTTVEVLNTDAEGRLILADALVRAAEDDPDLIVDIATLTGAQIVALGSRTSGVMGNGDDVRDGVWEASRRAGESMWPMPLPDDLRASLDSQVADIANIGDRNGGMLTAGLFLRDFVDGDQPWVHLDIAGPSFNESAAYGYTPKGATGAGVRTLVQVAEDLATGELEV
ncbi:MAG: leucyl aminopeptidase [Candidatus Nanopelagicales bacterium]